MTSFLHLQLPSPLVLASGIWGTSAPLLARAAQAGCGAVTTKSAGPEARGGHVNPTCIDWGVEGQRSEVRGQASGGAIGQASGGAIGQASGGAIGQASGGAIGLLNAIGLPNPGAHHERAILRQAKMELAPLGSALIASFFADTVENFGSVAAILAEAEPDLLEANISCPNVHSDFGEPFAASATAAAAVTARIKEAVPHIPLIVKLAPDVPDIARIAGAVVEAGADAICAINTMPGMIIDIESGQPVLQNRRGGVSGPALLPISLRCVYEIHKALPATPIIGVGGVTSGRDAIAMLMAGATLVGVGSAIHFRGPDAIALIHDEMMLWLAGHGYSAPDRVHALAHQEPVYDLKPTPAPIPGTEAQRAEGGGGAS